MKLDYSLPQKVAWPLQAVSVQGFDIHDSGLPENFDTELKQLKALSGLLYVLPDSIPIIDIP